MFNVKKVNNIYLACGITDLRKSMEKELNKKDEELQSKEN